MKQTRFIILMIAAGLIALVGCSENATQTVDATSELNLEAEFGGYTEVAEEPGFGDEELMESESEEQIVEDNLAATPEMVALLSDPESGIFRFRAVWGQLRFDSSVTHPTDWSGSLAISRGGVLIRRTIRFELAQDYILPRVSRELLEWHSITTVHNDGIVADLIVPVPEPILDSTAVIDGSDTTYAVDTLWPDAVTVEFTTGPYSRTFDLGDLASLDTIITLDDSSQIAFTAYQNNPCPRGILAGRWGRNEEGQGVFRGRWIDRTGIVTGWLKGHYGINDEGLRVFYGKWIDRSGQFEGFLRGTWYPNPSEEANEIAVCRAGGMFEGGVFLANGDEIGLLKGKYRGACYVRGGFFQGRWKLHCPEIQPHEFTGFEQLDDGF